MLHHNVASAIPTDICKSIKTKLQIHLDWEAYDEKCWTYFESVVIKPHPHLIIDLVSLVSLMPEVDQLTIPYRRNVLLPINRLFFSFLSLKLDVTSWYFFSGSSNWTFHCDRVCCSDKGTLPLLTVAALASWLALASLASCARVAAIRLSCASSCTRRYQGALPSIP